MTYHHTTTVTLNGQPTVVYDGRPLPGGAAPNSYCCPLGFTPGRGWVLMTRSNLQEAIEKSTTHLTLELETRDKNVRKKVRFPSLVLVKAKRLEGGALKDSNSLYLVELADRRHLLTQFSDTGILSINLRSFANAQPYLQGTEGYSWSTTVQAVWETMSSILGPFPGLPLQVELTGIPEDIKLAGMNAWYQLTKLLDVIGCAVAYNPHQATYTVISRGAPQVGLAETLAGAQALQAGEPITSETSQFPETIRVYFHTHYLNEGQQRDTEWADNWVTGNYASFIDVPTAMEGVAPGTVLSLWDDLPKVLDQENQPANVADLTVRAQARAERWLKNRQIGGMGDLKVYEGVVTDLLPGAEVKSVLWRAWGPHSGGTATELRSAEESPLSLPSAIEAPNDSLKEHSLSPLERFASPDIARRTFPNYPRIINGVQVWDASKPIPGSRIDPNPDGLISGHVVRWVAGSLQTLEDCWIRPISLEPGAAPEVNSVVSLRQADRYLGRLSGMETSDGRTLPLYVVQSIAVQNSSSNDSPHVEGRLTSSITFDNGHATLRVAHSTDPAIAAIGERIAAANPPANHPNHTYLFEGEKNATCRATWFASSDKGVPGWRLDWVECPEEEVTEEPSPAPMQQENGIDEFAMAGPGEFMSNDHWTLPTGGPESYT